MWTATLGRGDAVLPPDGRPTPVAPLQATPAGIGGWCRTDWWCPRCRREFPADRGTCPHDGARLEPAALSEPFLWIG